MKNLIYIAIGILAAAYLFTDNGKSLKKRINNLAKPKKDEDFPLKYGDSGAKVKKLQSALNLHAPEPGLRVKLSGDFNDQTLELAHVVVGKEEVDEKTYLNLLEIYKLNSDE